MPRLGTGQDDEGSPSEGGNRNVGVARAYPGGNGRDTNGLIRMMAVLLIVFLLRNLFLKVCLWVFLAFVGIFGYVDLIRPQMAQTQS